MIKLCHIKAVFRIGIYNVNQSFKVFIELLLLISKIFFCENYIFDRINYKCQTKKYRTDEKEIIIPIPNNTSRISFVIFDHLCI